MTAVGTPGSPRSARATRTPATTVATATTGTPGRPPTVGRTPTSATSGFSADDSWKAVHMNRRLIARAVSILALVGVAAGLSSPATAAAGPGPFHSDTYAWDAP